MKHWLGLGLSFFKALTGFFQKKRNPPAPSSLSSSSGQHLQANYPIYILVLIAFFVNLEGFLGKYSFIRVHEHHELFFAIIRTMGQMFVKNGPTGWNPFTLAGKPNYAGSLHPSFLLNPIAAFLPSWLVSTLLNVLLYSVILIGTYLYLRDLAGLSNTASFGGALFNLIAYFAANTNVFTDLWANFLPLLLVLASRLTARRVLREQLLYVFITILIFSVLYVPYTLPFMPVFHLFFIFLHFRNKDIIKHLRVFCLIWIGFLAFHAPEIYSILSLIPIGHRQLYTVASVPILVALSQLLRNGIFIVYPLLFLVPFAFVDRKKRGASSLILTAIVITIAIYILTPAMVHFFKPLRQFGINRFVYITGFLFAVLAATGLENLLSRAKNFGLKKNTAMNSSVIVAVGLLFLIGHRHWSLYVITTVAIAISLRFAQLDKLRPVFILLILMAVLTAKLEFNFREKHASYQRLFDIPKPSVSNNALPFRTLSVLDANSDPDGLSKVFSYQASLLGMETIDGFEQLYYLTFKRFWDALIYREKGGQHPNRVRAFSEGGQLMANLNLLSMANVRYIYSSEPFKPREELELLYSRADKGPPDSLKAQFLSSLKSLNARESLQILNQIAAKFNTKPTIYLYKNKAGFSRAWLVDRWEVKDNEKHVLDRLRTASIKDLKQKGFLSQKFSSGLPSAKLEDNREKFKAAAKISDYTPDRIEIDVKSNRPALLLISNSFDARWQVFIDGNLSILRRANYTFQGVLVPKGKHSVKLAFRDAKLSGLFLAFPVWLLLMLIFLRRYSLVRPHQAVVKAWRADRIEKVS